LRDAFLSGLGSGDLATGYHIEATYYSASSIINFVYTGTLQVDEPKDGDEALQLLEDLLDLLPVADSWELTALKEDVGRLIHDHELVTPDTFKQIKRVAKEARLSSLVSYCEDFENRNLVSLRILEREREN
jgi:hypothetical protein